MPTFKFITEVSATEVDLFLFNTLKGDVPEIDIVLMSGLDKRSLLFRRKSNPGSVFRLRREHRIYGKWVLSESTDFPL